MRALFVFHVLMWSWWLGVQIQATWPLPVTGGLEVVLFDAGAVLVSLALLAGFRIVRRDP